jgi:putative flippase GtrA
MHIYRHDVDAPPASAHALDLEIVIPVYNEERVLAASVYRLHRYLSLTLPFSWRITIADNASTDLTRDIARVVATDLPHVHVLCLEQKGRGRALRAAWTASRAEVVAYMDVDLSTDLRALLPLIAPLLTGHSEVAIGTRLAPGARVTRGAKRELISRSYNRILHTTLRAGFTDAQCGFKAIRGDVVPELLAAVQDEGWFFDTELLVLAHRRGMRIHEVPVDWVDDADSRVDIVPTALADLRGIGRLALATPLTRFVGIGIASTVAYALLFVGLAGAVGSAGASAIALALTAVANTAANRRLTFGIRVRERIVRHHAAGLVVFLIALALTNGALAMLHGVDARAPHPLQTAVLVVATLAATVTRYVALATWVFNGKRSRGSRPATGSLVPTAEVSGPGGRRPIAWPGR